MPVSSRRTDPLNIHRQRALFEQNGPNLVRWILCRLHLKVIESTLAALLVIQCQFPVLPPNITIRIFGSHYYACLVVIVVMRQYKLPAQILVVLLYQPTVVT